jgi:hypothetical protein
MPLQVIIRLLLLGAYSMELHPRCAECGAVLTGVQTCQDYFYRMLYWETEDTRVLDVHHLMVLCYHLQHPSLYTSDGLVMARQLLTEFVTFEGQRSSRMDDWRRHERRLRAAGHLAHDDGRRYRGRVGRLHR